jgi:hypothetical protein
MNKIVLILIIIIFLLIIYFIYTNTSLINENFGINCKNCDKNEWIGQQDCNTCNNCGWCIDDEGSGSCSSGNSTGPSTVQSSDSPPKICENWFYNGKCIWGPQCGDASQLYYNNYYNAPFYSNGSSISKSSAKCPYNCRGRGTCHSGSCFCDPGFGGESCVKIAPDGGSNRGKLWKQMKQWKMWTPWKRQS